jgi:hypothetical protein
MILKAIIGLLLNRKSFGFAGISPTEIPLETLAELEKLFSVDTKKQLEHTLDNWSQDIQNTQNPQERAYKIGYLRGLKEGLTGVGAGNAIPSTDKPSLHKQ